MGHGPGQLVIDGPTWAGGVHEMISRDFFQPQPFCKSVTAAKDKLAALTVGEIFHLEN